MAKVFYRFDAVLARDNHRWSCTKTIHPQTVYLVAQSPSLRYRALYPKPADKYTVKVRDMYTNPACTHYESTLCVKAPIVGCANYGFELSGFELFMV